MKKSLLLSLMIVAGLGSFGQINFGITAGGAISKTSEKDRSENRFGFYGGVVLETKVGKSMSFRPQVQFVQKGENYLFNEAGVYNYIELPVNLVYNFPVTKGRFFAGGGPALAYAANGYWEREGKPAYNFEKDVNKFDYGVNFIGGFALAGGFFFTASYTLGFNDVWKDIDNKNRAFGFGIGKMFK